MQRTSLLHTFHNHAGHLGYLALRIFLHHRLHLLQTALGIALVEQAQAVYEEELRTVLAQREALCRHVGIALHLLVAVGFERLVGSSIERVLYVLAEAGVLLEVGIVQQDGPLTLRML